MFGDSVLYSFRGPMNIHVEVHSSYLQLVLIIALISLGNLVFAAIFLLMLTASIFAHEMGHAWASIKQGIPVRRLVIHGGGGFVERAQNGTARQQEFIVAMGPLVNLILWALGSGLVQANFVEPGTLTAALLANFAYLNLFLFIFNLLPMQPLDGGKLLNLVLLRVMQPLQATRLTGGIGLVCAVIWIPAAIFLLLTMGFILLFIPNFRLHYDMWKLGR